ncbi:MAG: Carboxylesterase NlhH [Verrucomicrobiota bacterium]
MKTASPTAIPLLLTLALLVSAPARPAATAAAAKGDTDRFDDAPAGQRRTYKESAGQPRALELYFPPGHQPASAKVPGLLLFHGGGWNGGSLAQFRAACAYFAQRGLVTATAEYQMLDAAGRRALPTGTSRKRVCVTDAKSALRWFKSHAAELGVDPARVITGGGSAGGHLAVLATTNPGLNDPADPKGIDTSVAAYLLFNPAFAPEDKADPEIDVLRHLPRWQAPALVFFGTQDTWKPGWDTAREKLLAQGYTGLDLQLAEGRPHGFFNRDPWRTVTLIEADRFLVRHGFLQGPPRLKPPATGETLTPAPAAKPAAKP